MKSNSFNSISFEDYFNEKLKDDEFKKEWESFSPEYQVMKEVINAREINNLTQKQLAELSGIRQSEISKLETGERNPSIKILKRIAEAMNMKLVIKFVKVDNVLDDVK